MKLFKWFWEETTVRCGNSEFEMGGFLISLACFLIPLFILMGLGVIK